MSDLPLRLAILYSSDRALVGRSIELTPSTPPITVGRDPACTIEVRSDMVSRRHARFELRPDGWHVVDTDSTSGTYVDDALVKDWRLRNGDKIRLGDTLLSFAEYIVESFYRPGAPDGLTGLATRKTLLAHLETAMRGGARPLSVIRIDVDKLEVLNDERGHAAGDRILAAIGAHLRTSLRPGEYPGRISADDFVVVLSGTEVVAASARAEELRMQLSSIVPVSVGAAEARPEHRDGDELIYTAEKDLYARYRRRS